MRYQLCTLELYFHGFPGYYSWIAKDGDTTILAGERFRIGLNWSSEARDGSLENKHYDKILSDMLSLGWEPLTTNASGKIVRLKLPIG